MTYNSKSKKYSVKYIINKMYFNELKVRFNMHREPEQVRFTVTRDLHM